jgi:hypothetical protein
MKALLILIMALGLIACEIDGQSGDSSQNKTPEDIANDTTTDEPNPKPEPVPPVLELPTCKKLCSKNHFSDLIDDGFSYLSFTNFGHRGVGRCRGHALVTQKMSILGQFSGGHRCDLEKQSCLAMYKSGIDKIVNYKTFEFIGFSNLLELSSEPKLQRYLRSIVANTSHRYRAVQGFMANRAYDTEQMNMYSELIRRVTKSQLPYVGVLGQLTGAHALLVYKTQFQSGGTVLCARDPNFKSDTIENCENYFFKDGGKVYFKRHNKPADYMSSFRITSDEDERTRQYHSSLNENCMVKSRAGQLCI